MFDIIIYIILALIFVIIDGLFIAAAILDRRTKKRQRDLARLIGARGQGKSGIYYPYCYLDQEREEEWME